MQLNGDPAGCCRVASAATARAATAEKPLFPLSIDLERPPPPPSATTAGMMFLL